MRKKINQNTLCLFLVIQVLAQIVQADVVTKGTTKATVTVPEANQPSLQSCSASSSSESSGKCRIPIRNRVEGS